MQVGGRAPLNSTWQDVSMLHPFNCTWQNISMELKYISLCMDIWKLGIYKKEENEKAKRQEKKDYLRHPLNSIRRFISMQIEYFNTLGNGY